MQVWPLLEIREALADADRNLVDVLNYVSNLQEETDGHLPPEASLLLTNIATLRQMLARPRGEAANVICDPVDDARREAEHRRGDDADERAREDPSRAGAGSAGIWKDAARAGPQP